MTQRKAYTAVALLSGRRGCGLLGSMAPSIQVTAGDAASGNSAWLINVAGRRRQAYSYLQLNDQQQARRSSREAYFSSVR